MGGPTPPRSVMHKPTCPRTHYAMGHVIEKLYVMRAEARGIADAAVRAWRGPGRERDLVVQSLRRPGLPRSPGRSRGGGCRIRWR
ncbi:hypothetical protein GCM10017744_019760 [Streptomyces antimycoticus]